MHGRCWDLIKHYEVSLSKMLHVIMEYDHYSDTLNWSDISLDRDLVTELDLIQTWPYYQISGGFHRTFATGAANQQMTLTLQTPGPVLFLGVAFILLLRSFFPELVMFPDLNFEHPSVLLFCFIKHCPEIYSLDAFQTPCITPFFCSTVFYRKYLLKYDNFLCLISPNCVTCE